MGRRINVSPDVAPDREMRRSEPVTGIEAGNLLDHRRKISRINYRFRPEGQCQIVDEAGVQSTVLTWRRRFLKGFSGYIQVLPPGMGDTISITIEVKILS